MSYAFPLLPYQKRFIHDKARFKVGMFCRQGGKSSSASLGIVDDLLQKIINGARDKWIIFSRGERQAKEVIDEGVKRHLQAYGVASRALEYDLMCAEGTYRALDVELPGGSKILALPANPDTARGFSANAYLDEFAIHKDSRKVWQALFPIITRRNLKLWVTSTPFGRQNKFYDIMASESDLWSKHIVDIYQAVADGLDLDIDILKEALDDPDDWAQEYELKFIDDATAWISFDLINSVEDDAAGDPAGYQGGPCFVGNDIGRYSDLWVAWVLEQIGDVLWTREISELKRAPFSEHDDTLDDIVDRYDVRRLCMDETGLGAKPVEDAKKRYGHGRVEGITFTNTSKHAMALAGKNAFQKTRIRIPYGNRALRADLHKLRKTTTPYGNIRFDAEADAAGHADRTWSLILALAAADNVVAPAAGIETVVNSQAYTPSRMRARQSSGLRN